MERVTAGDPDASYLIQKLEGDCEHRRRPNAERRSVPRFVDDPCVRQWIADGAPAVRLGRLGIGGVLATCGLLGFWRPAISASAEPYLAVSAGLKCANCHVNPSGGGKRTRVRQSYARKTQLVGARAQRWASRANRGPATSASGSRSAANFRGGYDVRRHARHRDAVGFRVSARDRVRPSSRACRICCRSTSTSSRAGRRRSTAKRMCWRRRGKGNTSSKPGRFFLPFGLRLQDDNAFVRQTSGINFDTPDNGVELGLELPKWSAQMAVTKGRPAAGPSDRVSLSAAYMQPRWRLGASYNFNNDPLGDREMQSRIRGLEDRPDRLARGGRLHHRRGPHRRPSNRSTRAWSKGIGASARGTI